MCEPSNTTADGKTGSARPSVHRPAKHFIDFSASIQAPVGLPGHSEAVAKEYAAAVKHCKQSVHRAGLQLDVAAEDSACLA